MKKQFIVVLLAVLTASAGFLSAQDTSIFENTDAPLIQGMYCSPFVYVSPSEPQTTLYYTVLDPWHIWSLQNADMIQAREPEINPQNEIPLVSLKISQNNEIVKSFFVDQPLSSGSYAEQWDGTDQDGNTVPDGAYTFVIGTKDSMGNTAEYRASVIKNGLLSGISIPSESEILTSGFVEINGSAVELTGFAYFEMDYATGIYSAENSSGTVWKSIPVAEDLQSPTQPDNRGVLQVQDGLLGLWWFYDLPDGGYTIRLKVVNKQGQVKSVFRTISIDNPLMIMNSSLQNPVFSPDGDGILDTLVYRYQISKEAQVRVKIFDASGVLVHTSDEENRQGRDAEGNLIEHQFAFDGQTDGGVLLPGSYRIVLEAESGTGLIVQEQSYFYIPGADSSVTAELVSPEDGTETAGDLGVAFSYKARGEGILTEPAPFTIRLSVSGTYNRYTVYMPVYGGPYYYDQTGNQPSVATRTMSLSIG